MNENIKENIARCDTIKKELNRRWPDSTFLISMGIDNRLYQNCTIKIGCNNIQTESEVKAALSQIDQYTIIYRRK